MKKKLRNKKKVLVFDWITSVGGVQIVMKNLLPIIAERYDLYFLDPYKHKFGHTICETDNIIYVDRPIRANNYIGWNRKWLRPFLLFRYGFIYLFYLISLGIYLKKEGIDIIYTNGKKAIYFAYIIKLLTGIKFIYHAHGFSSHKEIGFIYRNIIKKSEVVIAVSNDVKRKLIRAGINREKIIVIYNGVNENEIINKSKLDFPLSYNKKAFNIISISTIQEGKGIHILIEAVNRMLKEGYNCHLHILGDIGVQGNSQNKEYKERLIKLAQEVNSSRITFWGFQKNVFPFIAQSDVLVLPSFYESFGMVLVEAMCLKKAVVASNVGGIPEVIKDGINGLLFEAGSVEQLYNKLTYLMNNPDKLEQFGENGRKIVKRDFDICIQAKKICEILHLIN